MNKIVTLTLALSLAATAGFAGGVKDEKLKYVAASAPVVPSSLPGLSPLALLTFGGVSVAVIGLVLGSSGNSTPGT